MFGINEVSDKSIKYEWTGSNTILARLFSLANVFSAEIEILPQLNMDYSLNSLVLNVYREHSDQYQGIGANRTDKILRYGVDVEGITKTSDVTELYTSIKPVGKDGLTLVGMSKVEVDENGEQEYVLLNHDGIIRAVQARDRFPSNLMGKRNNWQNGTTRWTCLRLSNDIVLLFVKATATTKVDITSAAAKGYASREYTCDLPITIKTILYANSYVENNYNWENVELKIHSISSTAIKSHFWCQNSYKGLPLWWYYMLVAQM